MGEVHRCDRDHKKAHFGRRPSGGGNCLKSPRKKRPLGGAAAKSEVGIGCRGLPGRGRGESDGGSNSVETMCIQVVCGTCWTAGAADMLSTATSPRISAVTTVATARSMVAKASMLTLRISVSLNAWKLIEAKLGAGAGAGCDAHHKRSQYGKQFLVACREDPFAGQIKRRPLGAASLRKLSAIGTSLHSPRHTKFVANGAKPGAYRYWVSSIDPTMNGKC